MHFIGSFRLGVVFASLAAGPLVLMWNLCSAIATNPEEIQYFTFERALLFIAMLLASIPAGFLISVLPILLCTALMFRLGWLDRQLRSPVFWAGVGALLPGAALLVLELVTGPPDRPLAHALGPTPLIMVPGALCALIARSRTKWSERDVAELEADPHRR
ncbi:hypothetical protein GCM10009087_35800 [Sphingomonas oligophenolica]|uniref:DUF805 domain-containing protein n=1 Tax=Sphingomonas oligophenolica TaxID=301154 RepID=A0ABU9Y9C9_9SPHN